MIHENKWPIELFSSAEKEGVKKGLEEKKVQYISEKTLFFKKFDKSWQGITITNTII